MLTIQTLYTHHFIIYICTYYNAYIYIYVCSYSAVLYARTITIIRDFSWLLLGIIISGHRDQHGNLTVKLYTCLVKYYKCVCVCVCVCV